ncbi:hypothetical protein BpHYR1_051058 [Brachionus plicatilis]|uniref:Uncharacterized protein n=1 Tax=Brachionus plicatilis TaxID=10195 RepID=A0A3M7PLJ7_BRAPC|nr:hypothetical protein BpHYR1_051058 [Brachionus plicatilis]
MVIDFYNINSETALRPPLEPISIRCKIKRIIINREEFYLQSHKKTIDRIYLFVDLQYNLKLTRLIRQWVRYI